MIFLKTEENLRVELLQSMDQLKVCIDVVTTPTHAQSHPLMVTPTHSHTHSWSHPLMVTPTHSHTHSQSHPLMVTPTHGHTHSWSHPLTVTPTHSHTHSQPRPLVVTHFLALQTKYEEAFQDCKIRTEDKMSKLVECKSHFYSFEKLFLCRETEELKSLSSTLDVTAKSVDFCVLTISSYYKALVVLLSAL